MTLLIEIYCMNGIKRMKVKNLTFNGFSQIQNLDHIAIKTSKKIKVVITWLALNVDINFVGYVWEIGKNMAKKQEDIINA